VSQIETQEREAIISARPHLEAAAKLAQMCESGIATPAKQKLLKLHMERAADALDEEPAVFGR
jgi:hypothetical protein